MVKQVINYEDLNGVKKTKEAYFMINAQQATTFAVELRTFANKNNITEHSVNDIDSFDEEKVKYIVDFISRLVDASYGEKDESGEHFIKDKEKTESFKSSIAYDTWLTSILYGDTLEGFTTKLFAPYINQIEKLQMK